MLTVRTLARLLLLSLLIHSVVCRKKRGTSWFDSPKTSAIQSPTLQQIKLESKQLASNTPTQQYDQHQTKTITDVIDETLHLKKQEGNFNDAPPKELVYYKVGCFAEDPASPAFPELLIDLQPSIDWNNLNKTIDNCARLAYKASYPVFGLKKFGMCFSGKGAEDMYDKYGPSKECMVGVGGNKAYFVYTFNAPVIPMVRPTWHCFPKTSEVQSLGNQMVAMADLKVGDRVKTLDLQGKPIFTEVIAFLHREELATAEYLSITTDSMHKLRVSGKHLVFTVDNSTNKMAADFASNLKIGDMLQTGADKVARVHKTTMETGIGVYAPLTRHGTMIVDGVLVSCYAHWYSHTVAHVAMAPLRLWADATSLMTLFGSFFAQYSEDTRFPVEGVHWYARSLMSLVQPFVSLH